MHVIPCWQKGVQLSSMTLEDLRRGSCHPSGWFGHGCPKCEKPNNGSLAMLCERTVALPHLRHEVHSQQTTRQRHGAIQTCSAPPRNLSFCHRSEKSNFRQNWSNCLCQHRQWREEVHGQNTALWLVAKFNLEVVFNGSKHLQKPCSSSSRPTSQSWFKTGVCRLRLEPKLDVNIKIRS